MICLDLFIIVLSNQGQNFWLLLSLLAMPLRSPTGSPKLYFAPGHLANGGPISLSWLWILMGSVEARHSFFLSFPWDRSGFWAPGKSCTFAHLLTKSGIPKALSAPSVFQVQLDRTEFPHICPVLPLAAWPPHLQFPDLFRIKSKQVRQVPLSPTNNTLSRAGR